MREVNFSIPNANKASVGITTALYDRRALDCTSTLPLINSLNHLAYLTTSSARIREILTVDGGVERLVCILKQGRDREVMEMWKWNLAFQCLVNIGVRGSENVRTRVVEADMVPVIATLLDNYIKIIDKLKEKSESGTERRHVSRHATSARSSSSTKRSTGAAAGEAGAAHSGSRRQPPPPALAIPPPPPSPSRMRSRTHDQHQNSTSPRSATVSRQIRHQHARSDGSVAPPRSAALPNINTQLAAEGGVDIGLRPVRDADRLPSSDAAAINGFASQPESPTTPMAPVLPTATTTTRERRRPALRQHASTTDPEDGDADQSPAEMDQEPTTQEGEPMVDIQTVDNMNDTAPAEVMIETVAQQMGDLTANAGSETSDAEAFPMPHVPGQDGSIIATNMRLPANTIGTNLPPAPSPLVPASSITPSAATHGRYTLTYDTHYFILAAMPRDEDVLMSLQLLAYVSKYCNLRTYFQNSHLVPKLRLGSKADLFDADAASLDRIEDLAEAECEEEEYLLPDDVNIFPLVEKFTVRHHPSDMQYWAGVVMRNLCRKDDNRGGIRQCAYYKCGKWEEYPRQFAKCRRCRRTKYCSKECQKNAWVYHRHWCMVADGSR